MSRYKYKQREAKKILRLFIGIDPGVKTGVAVCQEGKLMSVSTMDFWTTYHYILSLINAKEDITVIIEVPETKVNWHKPGAAHDVGRICRESELLADGIERLGIKVIREHPQGKLDSDRFRKITGWTLRTNQHGRDAAMLVYGRK